MRDQFGFPGMRIMQFGFGTGGQYHLPHMFPRRCVAYTGTHDNNTIIGWADELRQTMSVRKHRHRTAEYMKALRYVHSDGRELHWDVIRSLLSSCADTTIFPVQDLLGLDARSRMNTPGTAEGNWHWRLTANQLTPDHAARLREMVELYDRSAVATHNPSPSASLGARSASTVREEKRANGKSNLVPARRRRSQPLVVVES